MQTTKSFVAVRIDGAVAQTKRLVERLEKEIEGVRWVAPDQFHVTVKFLGDMDNRILPSVCTELSKACESVSAFPASLSGLGTFPKGKPPRVIWAGVNEGRQWLTELYDRLDQSLAELGVAPEGRAYTPHLTLGRVGRQADAARVLELLEANSPRVDYPFEVSEVVLMESIKQRGSFIYEPIDTVRL